MNKTHSQSNSVAAVLFVTTFLEESPDGMPAGKQCEVWVRDPMIDPQSVDSFRMVKGGRATFQTARTGTRHEFDVMVVSLVPLFQMNCVIPQSQIVC